MAASHRHDLAQLDGTPRRRLYTGADLARARTIEDLRARAHRKMPRFVLEYLEAGTGEETTLERERDALAEWRFLPRTLTDESERDVRGTLLGTRAAMPLAVAPTGLNGIFRRHGDLALAEGAARAGVPFVQSTMSNDRMEDVARVPNLRHWWQLYVFGGEEVWQSLVDRAEAAGCEALVLTTNAQLFGRREWYARTRATKTRPSLATLANAARHPQWALRTFSHGMPAFVNVRDHVPKDRRGFFDSAFWIREHMPKALSWETVAKIRDRWKRPFLLKGLLHPDDVRRALDAGVDGVILGSHGGRQAESSVSALDVIAPARAIVGDRIALYMSGGIRRGSDILKALALGADAVLAGRAPLYGLCAGGADGVHRALEILRDEMRNELGQIGAPSLAHVGREMLVRTDSLPLPSEAAQPTG
ncbi:alpha-hydroxy acid oxidase [Sphingosinithalassobacter sp. LHW66-3]|uniref:alpha-hydroxy acid oxidase n=1 Tax=Sphingosinithalassobacter sp. LHW66-3 TaxID=3424718 RepID=UPI003D6B2D60